MPATRSYYRNEEFLRQIGLKIKALRKEKGLSQEALAFKCNDMDYSQINRMERGVVNFSVSYLFIIAEALEVSPEELLRF
ncbi:helix-turn-helix domain-containing protein [Parasegetibacter sp. NRK P23]|uniref:helix-turn-helix domain-containing protein n=1 Tax=Parasegetibacter sp. NRK P23 TaxID=2942999 RepID=UPI002042D3C8|nr:helix-turn-helix transcriptional regulator [Parasegetibacter sp. NRK P23]MCM5529751.1 helix-turn-helix domain-containing protein [Parasegetibacter sp. NRK P23]